MKYLNKAIYIDLAKYPIALVTIASVALLTFLCSFIESEHVEEINNLPDNRTLLDSIRSVNMTYNATHITVQVHMEAIYPVTIEQNIRFFSLELKNPNVTFKYGRGQRTLLRLTNGTYAFTYKMQLFGVFTAIFYRSKTILKSIDINIKPPVESDTPYLYATDNKYILHKSCFANGITTFMPGILDINPKPGVLIQNTPSHKMEDSAAYKEGEYQEKAVRISTTVYQSSNAYEQMRAVYHLYRDTRNKGPIAFLDADHAPFSDEIFRLFGHIDSGISGPFCADDIIVPLTESDECLEEFKTAVFDRIGRANYTAVTLYNSAYFNPYTNLIDVAKSISDNYIAIDTNQTSPLDIIRSVANAKYLVLPNTADVAYAMWLTNGTLIEITQKDSNCYPWTTSVSGNFEYKRIVYNRNSAYFGFEDLGCSPEQHRTELNVSRILELVRDL